MGVAASDTFYSFLTFANAYNAQVVDENGKIVLDQPKNKAAMIEAVKSYANIFAARLHAALLGQLARPRQQRRLPQPHDGR